ncbi:signal peptidase II [Xenorhabdus nematophila]|uniref:Lipoprotein signal peptidase n=1 Tax=Xenorhabdus nematophila (strain ATCC 19061 / DSM 3370 / CCUG 14189 / LMG 1036 / NCIMB 9965 / AN6) TaxID=406817 RepID=D3VB44_XENNA|nr:signal peptidase II [Xenorhabdus nematophila]CEF28749.1 prolipoprotein signal peptidase (SPase II) [Xenorhabdus nematophila str. Websteri]AYA42324.1 lipoprotein signal peptidase [Xenorhabdus nematophila]KHD29207.1 lipoprotein signal peptidase [Xenorhabdus nematophila]MBA0021053.1 signal peptidase II [Xenorhabdus nematophila]MCB4424855.1 lipoprotein signal peptidase [Xenorhabdus nematophila]
MNKPICSTGLRWLWLVVVVLILDLGSKYLVLQHFTLYESIPLIPYFNLAYAQNLGAAFSFLADKDGWQRWFFALVAIAIVTVLLVMMYRSSARQKLSNIAYALVIGGALGNLFDRLVHGFVVDFIDFYVGEWHWPTFNIADTAICIGAALIIIESFINPDDKKAASQK